MNRGAVAAIVAAGGMGTRMGRAVPKQFLRLGDRPILIHTLQALEACAPVDTIILGCPESQMSKAGQLLKEWRFQKVDQIVAGGRERQDTIWRALQAVGPEASVIFTHDAVRPLISGNKIEAAVRMARSKGAAILAVPEKCTVKRVSGGRVSETVDRTDLWRVQTPQAFRADWLREAYESARQAGVTATDDAMLVERLGHPVYIVEGEEKNMKITTPEDLLMAEALLEKRST